MGERTCVASFDQKKVKIMLSSEATLNSYLIVVDDECTCACAQAHKCECLAIRRTPKNTHTHTRHLH